MGEKFPLNRTPQLGYQTPFTNQVGNRGVQGYRGPTDSHAGRDSLAEKVGVAGVKVNMGRKWG